MQKKYRIEKDSLGEREVPESALYGIQTLRSIENYPISGETILPEMIKSYANLKISCAKANMELGDLHKSIGDNIIKALLEILNGKHDKEFLVDVYQAGAGTATNMNVNEVVANIVLDYMGKPRGSYDIISPNDHVNMSQSTNDTYPTAMRLAIASLYPALDESLINLEKYFSRKGHEFRDVIKTGRTHLQDAVAITLGQEFMAWANITAELRVKLESAYKDILVLSIGGTAIGTGINTHDSYKDIVIKYIKENTRLNVVKANDSISHTQSQKEILGFSSVLKEIAIEVSRISADLKIISSGPNTGFNEINLPAVQPGSSIMPGKVNPSIVECIRMICYKVIGSETTVSYCALGGHLELNTNMPLMSYEVINSMKILTNGLNMFSIKCIKGITANKEICKNYAYESSSLATVLNPIFGYAKVSQLVKKSLNLKKNIVDIIIEEGLMSKEELDQILDPNKLTASNLG